MLRISQPELNDLKHVDPADQVQPVVPAGGHHRGEQLVHQLLFKQCMIGKGSP